MEGKEMNKEIEIQNKPPEGKNNLGGLRGRLGRTVLAASMLTGIGAPVAGNAEEDTSSQQTTELIAGERELDSATVLREFVEQKGNEPLTFDEANEFTPYIADILGNKFDLEITREDMIHDTFILRTNITVEDLEYINEQNSAVLEGRPISQDPPPIFESIKKDYPDVVRGEDISDISLYLFLSAQRALYLTDAYHEYRANEDLDIDKHLYGVTTAIDDNVFMFLTSTNAPKTVQFYEFASDRCDLEASPAVAYVVMTAHEYMHKSQTTKGIYNDVHPGILANSEKLFENHEAADRGKVSGFAITTYRDLKEGKTEKNTFSGLDEFVVHYLATKALTDSGVPVITINNNTLESSRNFQRIMEQSGITDDELIDLHDNSQLNELFVRVAEGVGEKAKDMGREEKIKLGFKLFTPLLKNEINWEEPFAEYFDIELSNREIADMESRQVVGCGVPLIDNDLLASASHTD